MRALAIAVLAASLTACAQFNKDYGIDPNNQRTIEVILPGTVTAAQNRVQSAAVDSGWVVTAVFPGLVTVGPYKLKRTLNKP